MYRIDPKPGWAPEALRKKLDAGAQFVQTQFCMDLSLLTRYLDRLREQGHTAPQGGSPARWRRAARVGEVSAMDSRQPVRVCDSDAIIQRLDAAADPRSEGKSICIDILQQLADMPGVSGRASWRHSTKPRSRTSSANSEWDRSQASRRRGGRRPRRAINSSTRASPAIVFGPS